jgi:hypothetical protein
MKLFLGFLILYCLLQSCNNENRTTESTTQNDSSGKPLDTTGHNEDSVTADYIIEPGKSIGQVSLGDPADQLENKLGKPDLSDAAMGKAWLTWYGKRDEHNNRPELNIYVAYKDTSMREKTVQQLRSTSSSFATSNGVKIYMDLSDIQKVFPGMVYAGKYTEQSPGNRVISIYDDVRKGIAVEIAEAGDQRISTGIIIHAPGQSVLDIYRTQHPDIGN